MYKIDNGVLIESKSAPKAVLVFLHGYGADGNDVSDIGEEFARNVPGISAWMPDAPSLCEERPNGLQWFSLRSIFFRDGVFEEESVKYIDDAAKALCARIKNAVPDGQKIIIGGFSQGAALAYHAGFYGMETIGILGYSGFYQFSVAQPIYSPNLFWCHGAIDDVVPISMMESAIDKIKEKGVDVDTHIIKSDRHNFSDAGISHGVDFLKKIMAAHV